MNDDVRAVLARIDELGLVPGAGARGYDHMGAVLTDAAIQGGMQYTTVAARVDRIRELWPDADTTSRVLERMEHEDVAEVIDWGNAAKVQTFKDLARLFGDEKVETPADLHAALKDDGFRQRLREVKGVGPKTVDYLSILTGSTAHVAVDSQITAFVRDAGATASSYDDIRQVIVDAAAERGWNAGDLDAAIWAYQSERNRPHTA